MNGRLDVFKAGRRVAVGRRRTQRGVTLLEVMISVLILGVGILGIAAMQTTALRNSQSSFERSQAVMHSYAIIDAMRANRVAALAGAYNMAMACAAPGLGGGIEPALRRGFATLRCAGAAHVAISASGACRRHRPR